MSEKNIVESIRRYLKSVKDLFFWKEHGGIYGTSGIPDIICCYKGRFIAFEVKQPGNKPTILQQQVIKDIIRCGGYALKVDSVTQVKEVVEAFKNEI